MLGVTRTIGFANRADIPSAVDANMAEVVAFETRLMVARVVTGEWGIDRYTLDSPSGVDFMMKFSTLES